MKKIITLVSLVSAFFISGCSTAEVKQKQNQVLFKGPLTCKDGSKYSKVHDKCVVMNFELNGVIESKECNESLCSAIVLDERSRRIKIEADKNINVGDQVSIVLFKKGEQSIINSGQVK